MVTDTIIGLHARAFDKEAIERIYKIKKRDRSKGFIILIPSIKSLEEFGVKINKRQKDFLKRVWPGPVSVVFGDVAFRMPDNKKLLSFLKRVGPVVSTSANLSGQEPVKNIREAKKLFGGKVDEYLPGKVKSKTPSTVIKILR